MTVYSEQVLYIFSGELGQRAFIQGLLFDFLPPVLDFPPSLLDRSTQQILNDSRRYVARIELDIQHGH